MNCVSVGVFDYPRRQPSHVLIDNQRREIKLKETTLNFFIFIGFTNVLLGQFNFEHRLIVISCVPSKIKPCLFVSLSVV